MAVPAVAQTEPSSTTTTTRPTTTTTTTAPPTTAPPTTAPPTTAAPGPGPTPTTAAPAPGPSTPQLPTPPGGVPTTISANVGQNLAQINAQKQAQYAALQKQSDDLAKEVAGEQTILDRLDFEVDNVTDLIGDVLRRIESQRKLVANRAIAAYKGDTTYLVVLFESQSASEFLSRVKMLAKANQKDRISITSLMQQKQALETQQVQVANLRKEQRVRLAGLEEKQKSLAGNLKQMTSLLGQYQQQASIAVDGRYFPVVPPFTYSDNFGQTDEATGQPHNGTDVYCVYQSPLRAFESGTVAQQRNQGLDGLSFWLIGDSGTAYLYSHLVGYFPGIAEGTKVQAGQSIAYCGNSGVASNAPPHLHFEIHSGGQTQPPTDPYPVLKAIEQSFIAKYGSVLGAPTTTAPPGGVPAAPGGVAPCNGSTPAGAGAASPVSGLPAPPSGCSGPVTPATPNTAPVVAPAPTPVAPVKPPQRAPTKPNVL